MILPPFYRTFARTFSENAYYTLCCGKLHHTGPDFKMQGWQARIGCEMRISEKFIPGMDQGKASEIPSSKGRTALDQL